MGLPVPTLKKKIVKKSKPKEIKHQFKVGDRVILDKVSKEEKHQIEPGLIGTVKILKLKEERGDDKIIGVNFKDFKKGHRLNSVIRTYSGWYCDPKHLSLYKKLTKKQSRQVFEQIDSILTDLEAL